ncbi:DUF7520 family protein [Halocatena marina]|uniref:DUF7520 family protein n=1 Tax=Halocatena marina TaxID=2934937 RepID=UPI0020105CDA|nr:cox cluster protein [Halocatena marina]
MSQNVPELGGRKFVMYLYVTIVGIAAMAGFTIGSFGIEGLDPELFGVIQLPPTAIGMAVYGALTIATLLGSIFLLMIFVSNRYAEPVDDNS